MNEDIAGFSQMEGNGFMKEGRLRDVNPMGDSSVM